MDALSFNPLQSGVAAAASLATDAVLPDGGVASIDFAALLALGMNPDANTAAQLPKQTEETAESSAMPQQFAQPAPESLIALPQPVANVSTQAATAPDALQAKLEPADASDMAPIAPGAVPIAAPDAPRAQMQPADPVDTRPFAPAAVRVAAEARAPAAEAATAAVVADAPANIAGDAGQPVQPTHLAGEKQDIEQHAHLVADLQQAATPETRLPAEASAPAAAHSHAAQMHPAESRAPLSQPSALLEVQAPVSEPGFAQALSRQVVWMVDKDAQVAELRINPPELGPVEVRLTLTQDSAAAEFVSPHAEVRAAIENAIVRLRESLADAGIQLGETSVSAESFSDRANGEAQPRMARDGYRDAPLADHAASRSSGRHAVAVGHGLVDVFA